MQRLDVVFVVVVDHRLRVFLRVLLASRILEELDEITAARYNFVLVLNSVPFSRQLFAAAARR